MKSINSSASKFFVNGLLLIFTLTILLAVAELFLRKFKPIHIIRLNSGHYLLTGNPSMSYEPRPSSGDFNADGIRGDREYSRHKPASVYRIVVIGDSLAFGLGLSTDETFAGQLEKKLNERSDDVFRYEVINLAVPGYRISEIVRRFREKGLKYDPDLVIYWHWLDDVYIADEGFAKIAKNPVRRKVQQQHDAFQDRAGVLGVLAARALELHIVQHSVRILSALTQPPPVHLTAAERYDFEKRLNPGIQDLYTAYTGKVRSGVYKDKEGFEKYYTAYTDPDSFLQWNAALFKLARTCRHYGIDCLLLQTPILDDRPEGDTHWSGLHGLIREVASQHAIPSLDLTEVFSGYPAESLKVKKWDPEHPNALGNRLLVDSLREHFLKNKSANRFLS